ncbi:phytanoyl-CoA dioxygenase family protein [Streptomyces caelestis]|uniref:Ectoine hydroxylase-related dioxygenase (Phytanoyl-CoA dioxygenase family) n=1 Tax=Streptomyces caelestis TaxID=36816 RepID=A0A7W9GYN4_9ACTN|nr:phytanoyl-CoA dioxygenase family protein [Streptomyces caelestis]MBB5792512.1 ectoine hydroxylase-related dioxygenase (phytanoyl-CoA dioxygenase family) [Streptomyces caelestis]GGW70784.1 protein involved in biosynthesis of mitomycin antibiotics/polyketide fumonisin [Streptomyces caelestis]
MTVTGNGAAGVPILDPAALRRYREGFEEDGFTVVRGLFGADETERLCEEFTTLRAAGPVPGHFEPRASGPGADPLHVWPRVMHPHEINDLAREVLLDARLRTVLEVLLGEEALAAQSMFYFKPPGARGQALHQDNFYLRVEPGTCVAAWLACDMIDRENGGLEVVPGTHRMDLFCPQEADAGVSFAREYVPPPPGLAAVPVGMEPGDVLFFNGSLVHGSQPNRAADRFRRSFIGHYVGRSAERIGGFYRTMTMSGARVVLPESEGAGPCGTEFAPQGPH